MRLSRTPRKPLSDKEEIALLKKRINRMSRGFAVLGVCVVLALLGIVKVATSQKDTTREGLQSRVKTVQQRCDLTSKITEVLRKDDPSRVHSFEVSREHCEAQLGEVQKILRKAK